MSLCLGWSVAKYFIADRLPSDVAVWRLARGPKGYGRQGVALAQSTVPVDETSRGFYRVVTQSATSFDRLSAV